MKGMSQMLEILRSVQVKVIMTERSRVTLINNYKRRISQLHQELQEWQFQSKKLLTEAHKKSGDAVKLVKERIVREERLRKEKIEMLQFQLKQAENLPEGSESDYTTVQSSMTIQIGDVWDDIMTGTEIILKDGRVHEIRQKG